MRFIKAVWSRSRWRELSPFVKPSSRWEMWSHFYPVSLCCSHCSDRVAPTAPQTLNPVLSPAAALRGSLPFANCHADVSMHVGREGPAEPQSSL